MTESEASCPACQASITSENRRRRCALCGWKACRKCAGTKFCPDCKKATMENA